MMIEGELDEICTIRHVTAITSNSYGSPVETATTSQTRCKFVPQSDSRIVIDTKENFRRIPKLILPHDVVLVKGDTVSTTESNYEGTYIVTSILAAKTRYGLSTGFILCELDLYE